MNDNKKELISQSRLKKIMFDYIISELDKCDLIGRGWSYGCLAGTFYWRLNGGYRARDIGSRLCNDYWGIYNDQCTDEYTNIKIYPDHVEFIDESKFTDFDPDFMYGLYMKIKEVVEGDDIEEVNEMSNNKGLISKDELKDIIYQYIKPELDKLESMGGSLAYGSQPDTFFWILRNGIGPCGRSISSYLCYDHWEIFNDYYKEENRTIKIYPDHVEFNEDSKFTDFDKEFMRGLYDKIKEYIEYNNTTNRVVIEIDLDRDKNDLTKLMGSFHNIFTGQSEYVNNDIVLSSDKLFDGEEFDGNVAENIINLKHQDPHSISRMLNDMKQVIDVIAYNNLQEPEFYEYLNDYNTYVDKLYGPSCKGEITRKKRDVPLKTIEEICKDNGVKWKPNNDNPNNNIKVDSNAEVNTFGDGAVRSSKKGKGRYDLIPGCVMVDVISSLSGTINHMTDNYIRSYKSILLKSIYKRNWVGAIAVLTVLGYCNEKTPNEIDAFNKMQKDLALHYENGAEIYGENNWKKGIPIESFISSGIRHTQQYLSGLTDEPHLISAIWNFCNAAWCEKKEELYK